MRLPPRAELSPTAAEKQQRAGFGPRAAAALAAPGGSVYTQAPMRNHRDSLVLLALGLSRPWALS